MTDAPTDTKADKLPLSMALGAAFGVVAEAQEAAGQSGDHMTACDARTARGMLDHAMWYAARGENDQAETAAAKALELAIEVIRRSQEIDVGLRRAMTEPQVMGHLLRRADTEHMQPAERQRVEGQIAAWWEMPPWQEPKGEDLDRCVADVEERLDALLRGTASVTPRVSCWLAMRRALGLGSASWLLRSVLRRTTSRH